MVRTVLSVETGAELVAGEPLDTTNTFCLAACWALARAAISSSCKGTGVSACNIRRSTLGTGGTWTDSAYLVVARVVSLDVF